MNWPDMTAVGRGGDRRDRHGLTHITLYEVKEAGIDPEHAEYARWLVEHQRIGDGDTAPDEKRGV